MKKIIILLIMLSNIFAKAQDGLLSLLEVDNEPMYISSTFKGKKVKYMYTYLSHSSDNITWQVKYISKTTQNVSSANFYIYVKR